MHAQTLASIARAHKRYDPDLVLYVDRMDKSSVGRPEAAGELPALQGLSAALGPSFWLNTIIALTHAGVRFAVGQKTKLEKCGCDSHVGPLEAAGELTPLHALSMALGPSLWPIIALTHVASQRRMTEEHTLPEYADGFCMWCDERLPASARHCMGSARP